jgi:hypothetical protein
LSLLAIVTLILKSLVEWKTSKQHDQEVELMLTDLEEGTLHSVARQAA